MILFVFEGERSEPRLFRTIEQLYFRGEDVILCSYGNDIYELYREMRSLGDGADIVAVLKNKGKEGLEEVARVSDFSEVYLFFDYDIHDVKVPVSEFNTRLQSMLNLFDDETGNGKLYVNYPMIESLRYTKRLPDDEYVRYSVSREECRDFKRRADEFSYYPNWDFILLRNKRLGMEKHTAEVMANWEYLKEQNVKKANYICSGGYEWPATKEEVAQMNIFLKQKAKYQSGADCRIPVLNTLPIFLYDYFKRI